MKRLNDILFVLLSGAIVLSFACGKPCSGKIVKCKPLPLYLKYFGMYKIGNYWNYETEVGSIKDSLYVEDFYVAGGALNEETCEEFSNYSFVMLLTHYPVKNNRLLSVGFRHKNSCNEGELKFYYKWFDIHITLDLSYQIVSSEYIEIIPEIMIDGLIYNNIMHVSIGGQWEYFFAPEVGLVRFAVPNSQGEMMVYNLKNYHIQ